MLQYARQIEANYDSDRLAREIRREWPDVAADMLDAATEERAVLEVAVRNAYGLCKFEAQRRIDRWEARLVDKIRSRHIRHSRQQPFTSAMARQAVA